MSIDNTMANHLMTIKGLADGDHNEELSRYISGIDADFEAVRLPLSTGSPVTDVVLGDKYRRMEEKHIRSDLAFSYNEDWGIPVYDISIILTNVLDNAIEASMHLSEDRRYIDLKLTDKPNVILIRCENTCDSNGLHKQKGKDDYWHGIGLKNVEDIVKRFDGAMDISEEKGTFIISVMMKKRPWRKQYMKISAISNPYAGSLGLKKCQNTNNTTNNFAVDMITSQQDSISLDKSMWSGDMVVTLLDKLKGISYGNSGEHKNKDEMTIEEYKQWFMNETAKMPVSGWMQSNFSQATLVIKDEAFERMKNDPEYEEYVMKRIRSYYSASGINTGMNNVAYEVIGASPEECYGYAEPVGGSGSERITSKDKSWWERRHEKMEELIRQHAFFHI